MHGRVHVPAQVSAVALCAEDASPPDASPPDASQLPRRASQRALHSATVADVADHAGEPTKARPAAGTGT
jgi:hypothetical protein